MEVDEIDQVLFGIAPPKYLKDIMKTVSPLTQISSYLSAAPNKIPIFLLGYPCDIGTKLSHGRPGQERGPAFFRQFLQKMTLPLHNPFYNTNIDSTLSVFDLGDLDISEITSLDTAHKSLADIVTYVLSTTPGQTFIVGGSNDCSLASAKTFADIYKSTGWTVIHIDGGLDCNEEVAGVHNESAYRKIHEIAEQNNGKVVTFGCQAIKVHADELEYVKSKGGEVYFLKSDIRNKVTEKSMELKKGIELKTAAGILFNKILAESQKDARPIFISWDASSLNVDVCPGVTSPAVTGGFSLEEAEEIALVIGQYKGVRVVEFSEINPAMECYITCTMIVRLFYLTLISQAI